MTRTVASIRALVRPPFAVLLALSFAIGAAQTGHFPSLLRQAMALATIAAWMLCAVALNDYSDEQIDRVNLAEDPRRLLVTGLATRKRVLWTGLIAAIVALAVALLLGPEISVVVAGGVALAIAYSMPPFSLSRRGIVASAALPLGYVAIPFLIGSFASGVSPSANSLRLLAGLYLGFMGRLALKDFRDERGDRLYGKRTTLVRYGRQRTCVFSGGFWAAGGLVVLSAVPRTPAVAAAVVLDIISVGILLAALARDRHGRDDPANIAAIAAIGRGFLATILLALVVAANGWSAVATNAIVGLFAGTALVFAWECRTALLSSVDELTLDELEAFASPAPVDQTNEWARNRFTP